MTVNELAEKIIDVWIDGKPNMAVRMREIAEQYRDYVENKRTRHLPTCPVYGRNPRDDEPCVCNEHIDKLIHYHDTTVGLWCIDRNPKEVSKDWIEKNTFQLEKVV